MNWFQSYTKCFEISQKNTISFVTFAFKFQKNMSNYQKIQIKDNKSSSILRRHHWLFSGAIHQMSKDLAEGELVDIFSNKTYLATGHFQPHSSIAVRILSFEQTAIDANFFIKKFDKALNYRRLLGFLDNNPSTNVFRLINGEGDELPGLIIDFYNGTAVVQCHSVGMYLHRTDIVEALKTVLGNDLKAIFDKSADTLPHKSTASQETNKTNDYLFGSMTDNVVLENGHSFVVDWEQGQKTGFFIDQRFNRELLGRYCEGKNVLNAFCYSGGFSVYAAKMGAKSVLSIDSSQKAIDLTVRNMALNGFDEHIRYANKTDDVMDYLKIDRGNTDYEQFDVIVIDPPAFAKHIDQRHQAIKGYTRLNEMAIRRISDTGGFIFTFSCSQVVDRERFEGSILAAAINAKRTVKIVHRLSSPADHPVNIFHPEGDYLKGLVLYVE